MRGLRKGFTLIELIIAIMILTIMMIFLYQSYAQLNLSNATLKKEVTQLSKIQKLKKAIYLDFLLIIPSSIKTQKSVIIQNRDTKEDAVFFQSSHSLHKRYNPYISYIVKNSRLYRLESLKKITSYELPADSEFSIDDLGEVKNFRVYPSTKQDKKSYLVNVGFIGFEDILLKVRVLNEY